jgi:O-antigen/teichoic acid export membrane protein
MSDFNLKRLILKNTGAQILAQAVSLCIGFVTSYVLSRRLGVEGFGQFNYVFAFFYFFQTINDFGVNTIVVREISKKPERADDLIGAMISFKVILAALSIVATFITISLMDFPSELRISLYIFSLILPILALQLPTVMFQVLLKIEYPAVIGIATRCFGFAIMLLGVWFGYGLVTLISAQIFTEFISLILLLYFVRNLTKPRWRIDLKLWKSVLHSSIPLGIAGIFVALINRIDFLMLERLSDLTQVGLYAACYKVTNLLETLPLMIMGTLYPLMSRYAQNDLTKLRTLYLRSALYLGAVAIPIGVSVTLFASQIIFLLFGNKFAPAALGLRILVWSTVFLYVGLCGGNLLISIGQEKINLLMNIIGTAINIGMNYLLIPSKGFVGAAIATSVTYFIILLGVTLTSYQSLYNTNGRARLPKVSDAKA